MPCIKMQINCICNVNCICNDTLQKCLQNAMSDSELIKLVEKITDGGTCTFLRPHGAAPDLPKSCGGEGEEARAAGLRRAYRKHGVRVPFGTVKASGKFRVGVAGYS